MREQVPGSWVTLSYLLNRGATGSHAETAGICKLEGEGFVCGHDERGSNSGLVATVGDALVAG